MVYKLYFNYTSKPKSIIHEGICTKIAVTSTQCIELINELESYKPDIVGFDIEWSSKKDDINKVSLIQIGHSNIIILIRLNLLKSIPGKLHDFLGNVEILKAGIGIYDDKKKLEKDYNLIINGCIDINHIFSNKLSIQKQQKLRTIYYEKDDINDLSKEEHHNIFGLNSMHNLLFKQKMKYKDVKYTFHEKWNNHNLSTHHIQYAADDALVGYKLFIKLMDIIQEKENNNDSYLSLCYGLIDVKKDKKMPNHRANASKSKIKNKNKNNNQKTIIQNCDVCGKEEKSNNLCKYYIVPTKYLRYMTVDDGKDVFVPSNNGVITCKPCKKLCNKNADNFREYLCQKYNISGVHNRKMFIRARTASSALIDSNLRYKIPINTQIDMVKDICLYYNLLHEIVYKTTDNNANNDNNEDNDDEQKDDNEYKWQWYNNESKKFQDYTEDLSEKIENGYVENRKIMHLEINVSSKWKLNTYEINFESMEQQNITSKSRYKRGIRRIFKTDNNKLKQYDINKFDHLIKIINYNNKCGVDITTNDIILWGINDIIQNQEKSVSLLQREQFEIHSKFLCNIIKDPNQFTNLWKENFINNIKPKNYKP